MQPTTRSSYTQEVFIKDFGMLDLSRFDIDKTSYQGQLYNLRLDSAKTIAEAIGFTARFENDGILTAYFDTQFGHGGFVFEMAKNTKPTDVGLRYTAYRWTSADHTSWRAPLRPSLKLTYYAKDLPDDVLHTVSEQLNLNADECELFYIRVNFKENTYALILEDDEQEKLPPNSISTFRLVKGEIPKMTELEIENTTSDEEQNLDINANKEEPEQQAAVSNIAAQSTTASVNTVNDSAASFAKYATYSRSEIDQLLKQQAETISGNLNSKISGQQKAMQDLVKTQERNIKNLIDEIHVFGETFHKDLEAAEGKHLTAAQKLIDQARKDLAFEIEQFRSHLNRQVYPNLKSLDERIISLVSSSIQNTKPEQKKDRTVLFVAVFAVILGLVALTLIFIGHPSVIQHWKL